MSGNGTEWGRSPKQTKPINTSGLFAVQGQAIVLLGPERDAAIATVRANHYTRSVPSGKSHYVAFAAAIVVWSLPANKNLARFLCGWDANVWELSRLWAPDGHEKNLLTRAISAAVDIIISLENPDALVSYADPNAGHRGGVYRAASWIYAGSSEDNRVYLRGDGQTIPRRAFHSGKIFKRKADIEAEGYTELKLPGKERFVKPLTKQARRVMVSLPWVRRMHVGERPENPDAQTNGGVAK